MFHCTNQKNKFLQIYTKNINLRIILHAFLSTLFMKNISSHYSLTSHRPMYFSCRQKQEGIHSMFLLLSSNQAVILTGLSGFFFYFGVQLIPHNRIFSVKSIEHWYILKANLCITLQLLMESVFYNNAKIININTFLYENFFKNWFLLTKATKYLY